MKGNYYLFEPLVDEKGEQEKRRAYGGEHYEDCGMVSHSITGTAGLNFPILTMKKFDHDPFERIKKVYEAIKSLDPTYPESGEESVKYQLILFALGNAAVKAISETVKELEE